MSITFAGLCFTDATGVVFSHNGWMVALSYVLSAVGSFAALEMAERLHGGSRVPNAAWLAGSAATLGGSIWAMHFVGILALNLGLPVAYSPSLTLLSLVVVIIMVAVALQVGRGGASYQALRARRLIPAGMILGCGVAMMHHLGIAAMVMPARVAYHPGLWSISILIAMCASTAALWLALVLRTPAQRALAGMVMALAVCGMHYVGMAATQIFADLEVPEPYGVAATPLAFAVAGTTLTLFLLAIVSVRADRRLFTAARDSLEALRSANIQLKQTQREIVRRLCLAAEFRDNDTGQHVDRIGRMAERLAIVAGCERDFATDMLLAAPLHDIGKIGIPDSILLKPGPLTGEERIEMQRHAEIGYQILHGSGLGLLDFAADIALQHHEKWDGSGYPHGLAGFNIPLASRMVAIVDVFDALMSLRPYKVPWPLPKVVEFLRAQSAVHFDSHLVDIFLSDLETMMLICGREMPAAVETRHQAVALRACA